MFIWLPLIGLILVAAKAFGFLLLSWWFVLMPFWLPVVFFALMLCFGLMALLTLAILSALSPTSVRGRKFHFSVRR